jgi:tuftelin-interacting protein 11
VIGRLQNINLVVDNIDKRVKSLTTTSDSLEVFSDLFDELVNQFSKEFDKYRLDEVVVGAMAPTVSNFPPPTMCEFILWRR